MTSADPTPTRGDPTGGQDLSKPTKPGDVTPEDLPHLTALTDRLEDLRQQAGLSRNQLSALAGRSDSYMRALVAHRFRPRELALEQFAVGLAAILDLDAAELHAELVALAGPSLAPSARPEYRVRRPKHWQPRPDTRPPYTGPQIAMRQVFASVLAADLLREVNRDDIEPGDEVDALRAALDLFLAARPIPSMIAASGARLRRLDEIGSGDVAGGSGLSRQPEPGGA